MIVMGILSPLTHVLKSIEYGVAAYPYAECPLN